MKISVLGTGYVGLVQGAVLADSGHHVSCVDIDEAKLQGLREGEIPIFEPGLEAIVKGAYAAGRRVFSSDAASAIAGAQVHFIAVGTPPDEEGSADLRYVLAVAQTIASHIGEYAVIVDKSTVPVGTADQVTEVVRKTLAAHDSGGLAGRRCAGHHDRLAPVQSARLRRPQANAEIAVDL